MIFASIAGSMTITKAGMNPKADTKIGAQGKPLGLDLLGLRWSDGSLPPTTNDTTINTYDAMDQSNQIASDRITEQSSIESRQRLR